jgi:hypothetical protein
MLKLSFYKVKQFTWCTVTRKGRCGRIAINPDRFDKLITALRTAVDNDGVLDKNLFPYGMMSPNIGVCSNRIVIVV